jgi:hypothetical protein
MGQAVITTASHRATTRRLGGNGSKTPDGNSREQLLRGQLISPDDTDQAVRLITRFYRRFHSSRWVKDLLVIQLNHAPSPSALAAMNEDFADLIDGAPIHATQPTPEEVEDGKVLDRPRIAFGVNRRDHGRLRELIEVLNGL